MDTNLIKSFAYTFIKQCGDNKILCGISTIVILALASIVVFLLVKEVINFTSNFISKIKQFTKNYGEDKLFLRTVKRIGDLNFARVLYYEYIQQKLVNPIRQIYYPSTISLIATILFSIAIFYLPGENLSNKDLLVYLESNYYQNFIAIHAGIGAIILAFLILVAETSDSGKNHNKARLILKETWLFPLATLEILSLLLFAIGNKSLGSVLSIFTIGLLTIRAIYKVTELFINRYSLQEKERELMNDRFSTRLDQAIKERIATNTLLEYLEQSEYAIDYSYFRPSKENIKAISLSKKGVLNDIHLGKLEKLLRDIEKEANQLGLSIKKSPQKDKKASKITTTVTDQEGQKFMSVEVSILKLIGGQIFDDSREILALPKSLFEIQDLKNKIQRSVDSIFIVKPEDSIEKEIRLELDEAKDKAFSAIQDSKVGILSSVMDTYVGLVDQFLNIFQSYGGGYTSESARKERNSLFGGWPYIKWIREDLHDVLSEAIRSEKEKLVKEVTYIPIKILYKAFLKRDHLIFQEFMSFQPYLYWETQNIKDEGIKEFLIDRASRYFIEFADYRITPDIEDPDLAIKDIQHIKDFVYEILQSYKNLLKYAFDRKDVTSFNKFLSDSQTILHRFEPTEEFRKVEVEIQLKAQNITDQQKEELNLKLQKITLFEEVEASIKSKKQELVFGFAAWCLHKLKELNFESEPLLTIWNNLLPHLPTQLDSLLSIYESSYRHNIQDFWGWDWWELETKNRDSNDVVMTEINFDGKIHTLFALLLLKILSGKTDAQVDITKISISRDSSFYFEKDDSFVKSSVVEISGNQTIWEKVLNSEEAQAKQVALNTLTKLVEKQKQEEKTLLVNTHIDPIKVEEFINNFVDAYKKEVSLRKVLLLSRVITNIQKVSKSKNYWGFNEIQDKEPFLTSWHVDYGDFGEHYGRGLGDSEDQIIFGQLRSGSIVLENGNTLSEAVSRAINQLITSGFKPTVIFTNFHLGEWRNATLNHSEFIPSWEVRDSEYSTIANFVGLYKFGRRKIPIFRIWTNGNKADISEIVVSDLNHFIKLEQCLPYANKAEKTEMQLKENFAFKITDLSEDSNKAIRDKLVADNPSWLQKHTDKESFLKQKVIVYVKEKFEIKIKSKNASIKVKIIQEKPV